MLGLPRSGTAWLANWLTTDTTLCLHDPFQRLPEDWPSDERRLGISCTGAYLFPKWLEQQTCPVAVIERDPSACDESLAELGLPSTSGLPAALARVQGRRWRFEDIWQEDTARELRSYLLPREAFDPLRYRLLRDLRVETTKFTADTDVLAELVNRYT